MADWWSPLISAAAGLTLLPLTGESQRWTDRSVPYGRRSAQRTRFAHRSAATKGHRRWRGASSTTMSN